jgi:hypothetical protein
MNMNLFFSFLMLLLVCKYPYFYLNFFFVKVPKFSLKIDSEMTGVRTPTLYIYNAISLLTKLNSRDFSKQFVNGTIEIKFVLKIKLIIKLREKTLAKGEAGKPWLRGRPKVTICRV